jgi:broad specificity phosphatase PhoE
LEDNPLRHRKRAAQKAAEAGKPPPQLSSKMQYIEDNFKFYDYTKHQNKGDAKAQREVFEDLPNFEGVDEANPKPSQESGADTQASGTAATAAEGTKDTKESAPAAST